MSAEKKDERKIVWEDIDNIKPDPGQPRITFSKKEMEGLKQNIRSKGVIYPVEVDENDILITGFRRWFASKEVGLKQIPCIVVKGLSKNERLERQMIENLQREKMNPIEEAVGYRRLLEFKPIIEIAKSVGKSDSHIKEMLGLLTKTSPDLRKLIAGRKIKHSYALEANVLYEKDKKEFRRIEENIVKGVYKNPLDVRKVVNIIKSNSSEVVKEAVLNSIVSPEEAKELNKYDENTQEKIIRDKKMTTLSLKEIVKSITPMRIDIQKGRELVDIVLDIKSNLIKVNRDIELFLLYYPNISSSSKFGKELLYLLEKSAKFQDSLINKLKKEEDINEV